VRVADPSAVTPIDVEAGLISGHTAATSGPLATLTVDGWPPGSIATPRPDRIEGRVIALEVSAALDLDTVALVVDGEVHTSWTPSDDLLSRRFVVPDDDLGQWALVAGWGDTGQWVATGPVWTGPPLAP
jgi:hypothetical protein